MQRASFLIIGSIIFDGLALGLHALAGNNNLPEHNIVSSAPFQPGAGKHETHVGSQSTVEFPNANEDYLPN